MEASYAIYSLSLHDALPISVEFSHRRFERAYRRRAETAIGEGLRVGFERLDRGKQNGRAPIDRRSEEHTSELQSRRDLVCRLLLEKKKDCYANNYPV